MESVVTTLNSNQDLEQLRGFVAHNYNRHPLNRSRYDGGPAVQYEELTGNATKSLKTATDSVDDRRVCPRTSHVGAQPNSRSVLDTDR